MIDEKARKAFNKGYQAKIVEITQMGMQVAIDKFNMDYPRGQPLPDDMSAEGVWFAYGANAALVDHIGTKYDERIFEETIGN